jgi:peptidylprolyl isomerase
MNPKSLLLALFLLAGCKTGPAVAPVDTVEDLHPGTGETALVGSTLTVHYRGTLTSGQTFDSSLTREPIRFRLGARKVIKGWDQGLVGMKAGGKRKLIIPPRLGYGDKVIPGIPPGSWLIFEVELLEVVP